MYDFSFVRSCVRSSFALQRTRGGEAVVMYVPATSLESKKNPISAKAARRDAVARAAFSPRSQTITRAPDPVSDASVRSHLVELLLLRCAVGKRRRAVSERAFGGKGAKGASRFLFRREKATIIG